MIRHFNSDIITNGEQFVMGKKETAQIVLHRLRLFLGEFFLDKSVGTPWFQSILGKIPQSVAEINIKRQILSTPTVVSLTEFNFSIDAKTRIITISASLIDINNEQVEVLFSEELV